ncbi:M16 family metallopeptidase [Aestuariispira insulae]|uniref:M16 family metallopeptidase n=1 Tax=Aestuariispira insulae TaxID=1461337 RepID=UPI001FEC2EA5|nr:pitrilysin family protein [Aestuariispira insulae]
MRFLLFTMMVLLAPGLALADLFNPKTHVLDNGLQIVVVENNRAPVVTHMVWYKVGAMDEPPGKSGLAHFLEHLMFKKTKNLAAGEFSDIVARNGGRENAFTAQDYTGYFQTVAASRLPLMMELEAERMVNLQLLPEDVEPEREVILEERRSRVDNNPGARLEEAASAALFANHPYRIPIIGWEHEIRALNIEDLTQFYQSYYAPNNAIVVVSGDVKAEAVFAMAEKYYGDLEPRKIPEPVAWQEPPVEAEYTVMLRDGRVTQPSWSRRKVAPSRNSQDASEIYALEVLADILGGGATGRLYRALVIDQGIATSAGAWFDPDSRGPAHFAVYGAPREGHSLEDVRTAVDAEIAKLLDEGVTQDEVERAIRRVQDSSILALDSSSRPARVLGAALVIGMDISDVEEWPDRIAKVTADEVTLAARRVLAGPGGVELRLLPEEDAE